MNALIIYDTTGRVWNVTYGEDTFPIGLSGFIADIPEGCSVCGVDLSGETPKAKYEEFPKTELDRLSEKIDKLAEGINQVMESSVMPITLACTFVAESFTDEQAAKVPTLYPEWSPNGVDYKAGDRVRYADVLYKVLLNHKSQESWVPDLSPSLFVKILIPDPNVIPNWEQPSSENAYKKGDRVEHKNKLWESLIDNNVWEPGAVGSETLWKEVELEPTV